MVYYPVGTFIPAGFFLSELSATFGPMMFIVDAVKESFAILLKETSWLEWCGVITGTLCVWLAAKNNILNWPVASVSVLIYIFLLNEKRLYSDMELQIFFLGMNIYGWYYWTKNTGNIAVVRPVSTITRQEAILTIDGIILFTLISGCIHHYYTGAAYPFLDSFCTACSIAGQIFLARKTLQTWLIWIFVDLIYIGVYISKDLYATSIMYTLYIYIAWMGYRSWKKIYTQQA